MTSAPRFKDALEIFARHEVELIVVGGVAAVLGGAPIATFDLDVVHARNAANLDRLQAALDELEVHYRDPAGRLLRPETSALAGTGHHLLLTRCGPVYVIGAIGRAARRVVECAALLVDEVLPLNRSGRAAIPTGTPPAPVLAEIAGCVARHCRNRYAVACHLPRRLQCAAILPTGSRSYVCFL